MDEDDEIVDERVDSIHHSSYIAPEEIETGLEMYWETSALPTEYDYIPDEDGIR